jgi:hypothetical protein
MLLPLLRAIFAAQGAAANEALVGRISGLVTAVCKSSTPVGVSMADLQAKYAFCFRHAARSQVAGVTRPAIAACFFLLRLMDAAERVPPAGGSAVDMHICEALSLYWTSKKCRLPHAFFLTALERFPGASGAALGFLSEQLVRAAAASALTGRSEFLAAEAAKLCAAALRRKPSSANAAAAAKGLQPAVVLRGLEAALGLRLSKVQCAPRLPAAALILRAGQAQDGAVQAAGCVRAGVATPLRSAGAHHAQLHAAACRRSHC